MKFPEFRNSDFPAFDQYRNPEVEAKTKFVPMGGIDVTTANDEKPFIGTTSLASCAGIAIYDSENKVGGVAHVFFNEKESMTVYIRDAHGRDIPSTGRGVIINNPRPFAPFKYLAEALVKKADEAGGAQYKFSIFNVQHGCRTADQNQQLLAIAEQTLSELSRGGKITSSEYRNEQAFRLDTRSGQINSYCCAVKRFRAIFYRATTSPIPER